ncbi:MULTISPECIES: GNAT family N-acetyltransferase [Methylobacterium]|uniref:N-acetyltransferase domain-containing protein n=2 Tax=Pseudomonadota TaxID=1224 RepID=A0ABQ4SVJ7_9HYPH|nr:MULTISPECIES: GNAT family N-acetyltransferase [Methylobacterium]PIU05765.1 MAG: GNAT family N-acetyltransferase [Methylobacterium sp. CG09_land_8_20_14_0_10_71_15]PIU15306.1 MAG: GNAT family N-acetyltransferase [Methylobacterium sp. CG08_land_8_20_14_0_20_71_15]GBU18886.1 N-acetyltransferase [Methylobacterium sp.]GJE06493.1 hypothetical protein AOPFMNJM_1813 [Methylobacterium jeotgali]
MIFRRARPDSLADLPPVETLRLTVRPLAAEDAEVLRRLTDDPAITGAVDFLPAPFTLEDAQGLIASGRRGTDVFLGARARKDGTLVGVVGAHLRGPGTIEIGYWIGGAARGRGYGTEAVAGVLVALRQRFPKRGVLAECRPENTASWGLLTKLGFHETGAEGHRPGRRVLALEGT